ncbi:MAG TPA: DAK2 domain-containing protein, partial [Dehalococcoidia bacterium]|nr:DAK2 domain-containing protein [Dehalococcoidia bacterium]
MGDPHTKRLRRATRNPRSGARVIDGPALARMLRAGAQALRARADAINAINVFPVPDGDTGTNMSLTMLAAVDGIAPADERSADAVAKAVARGALMGAKGNSGVILSQILAGFAATPDHAPTLDGAALADALARARDAAYRVVSKPQEGTILTAISAAADAANHARNDSPDVCLRLAVEAAADAVKRTPELLPVLKEAGVVDSGAEGLYVLLDGMLRGLRGEAIATPAIDLGAIDPSWLAATERTHAHGDAASGFCTEFVVTADTIDDDAIRTRMLELGDSVLVVGGGGVLRVHVHTRTPDEALAYARSAGAVSHEKVDDMEAQFRALAAQRHAVSTSTIDAIAVVAVAAGDGLEALLASMGARVVRGGQTMNPSAGDIRSAIEATGASQVIVLPDNKNIVMAARLAAEGMTQRVEVIDARTIPQGVAALVALNTEAPFDDNIAAMNDAIASVRTAEVTHA